jgi:hypothetical protein
MEEGKKGTWNEALFRMENREGERMGQVETLGWQEMG